MRKINIRLYTKSSFSSQKVQDKLRPEIHPATMKEQNARISISDKDQEWDKTFWNIPDWDSEKIRAAKVMVVGAGALGNEVIKNLTLLNVGHIVVVDFDVVEYSNLAKSILFREEDRGIKKALAITKNLKKINSNVKTLSIIGDISTDVGLGVMRRMDVVIGCLDNRLARMFINRYCFRLGKTWVDGGIENLSGKFSVYTPGISCYECTLSEDAREIIEFRLGCPDIVKRNATLGSIATTPIASSIIAGFQVQEALKIIFDNTENSMAGLVFRFDGLCNFFRRYKESKLKQDCDSHEYYDNIVEAQDLSFKSMVKEVITWLSDYFKTENIKILLDEDIVLEVVISDTKYSTAIYKNHLNDTEVAKTFGWDKQLGETMYIKESVSYINHNFPYQDKTLKEMGIPFLHILQVETGDNIHFVELSGDESLLDFK